MYVSSLTIGTFVTTFVFSLTASSRGTINPSDILGTKCENLISLGHSHGKVVQYLFLLLAQTRIHRDFHVMV